MKKEGAKSRVLLVDDYPNNLFVMEVVLEQLDLAIYKAHSGEEALTMLEQEEFDLIVMDVKLPGMNGFDTAARVRDRWRELPILFLTGYTELMNRFDLCSGPADFLTKPCDPSQLREKVSALIRQRKPRNREANTLFSENAPF